MKEMLEANEKQATLPANPMAAALAGLPPALSYANGNNPALSLGYPFNVPGVGVGAGMGNLANSSSRTGAPHTLIHMPSMNVSQANPYMLAAAAAGYAPVLHPVRYVHPTGSSTAGYGDKDIDWSKHPYTPLEITASGGVYGNYNPLHHLPFPTNGQLHGSQQYGNVASATNASANNATSNNSSNNNNEPDWRDQIYYWSGRLDYQESTKLMVWKGKWIGSFTGKPTFEEFETNGNEFCYESANTIDKNKVYPAGGGGVHGILKPVSTTFKGYYVIDSDVVANGKDGTGATDSDEQEERYYDKEFILEFEEVYQRPHPSYAVYGKGDSEFGVFILNGSYDSSTRTMEMSREYLAEHDSRGNLILAQLKQYFKQRIGPFL